VAVNQDGIRIIRSGAISERELAACLDSEEG